MNLKFHAPASTDQRLAYAVEYLEKQGLQSVASPSLADFILLGINPESALLSVGKPVFAGNVDGEGIYDYTKNEAFAVKNAFLTAESAIALAVKESERSFIGANVLITGYGRIGKALHLYLQPLTSHITVCARRSEQRAEAKSRGAAVIDFHELTNNKKFDYIFNTVPHPVFNSRELCSIRSDTLLMELASFPGGIDRHMAEIKGLKLVTARGLPGVYSPETAGKVLGETLIEMIDKLHI